MHLSRELSSFMRLIQQQYSEALAQDDTQGMAETSGVLSISYAAMNLHDLSRRWAQEYLYHFAQLNQEALTELKQT
jgi:uncharacterized protein YcsI (UPF0317 family)